MRCFAPRSHDRPGKTRYPHPTNAGTSSTTDYEEVTWGNAVAVRGLVTALRLRDGASYAYSYDDLGRLSVRDAPGSTPDVSYTYDNFGRLVSASQPGHALSFAGSEHLGKSNACFQ